MTVGAAGPGIFVSYSRHDRDRVAAIVTGLRNAGLRVWWDADLPAGSTWRGEILRHLEGAGCVIVVWSDRSVSEAGGFVQEEASHAHGRGVLLPVLLDRVTPPLGFGQVQALDLVGWSGRAGDARFTDLVGAAKAMVAGETKPAPRAMPRRWALAGAGAAFVAFLGLAADVVGLQSAVCAVPGVHSLCGRMGLGGVPTAEQDAMWRSRPVGDCNWLRTFLAAGPAATLAAEADRLLQARRVVSDERWQPQEHTMPLYVRTGVDASPSEEAARADALARGVKEAERVCAGYASDLFRLKSASVNEGALDWSCRAQDGGVRCSFEGQAVCSVEARRTLQREVCE